MIEQIYKLNLIPGGVPVRVPVSQYDAGSRDITFSLYSGGLAFTIPAGAVVTCDGAKPDRKGFSYLATASGSTVTVAVTEQMTAVAGEAECQITIRKDGQVLGSANFLLVVERAALPDGVDMSETEISAVVGAANLAASAAQSAQKVADTLDVKKAALDASTEAADTANTSLTATTNAANTARTNLVTATNAGNTARTNLVSATNAANTAKDALTQPTADAQAAKTALDTANETAADNLEALNNADAMAQKIPKVSPAVAGNLAVLKADGTLLDSGKKPGDFAPGGYGLGADTYGLAVAADANACTDNGWYNINADTANGIGARGGMRVDAEDPGNLVQTVYTGHYSNSPAILRRIRFRSTWGDWEWVNPPMIAGAEYRTTERYLGKPVYVKLLAYSPSGTIGSLDGSTDIKIPHGISGFSKLVRWSGNKSGVLLPYVTVAGASSINIADANNLTFRIVKDVFSGGTWYFQLYYTKTT